MKAKNVGQITIQEPTINNEQIKLLRRKITDKMCKDIDFCKSMITAALKARGIKHKDVISHDEYLKLVAEHY